MKFFLIDFDGNIFIDDVKNLKNIYFSFPAFKLLPKKPQKKTLLFKKNPISFERYQKAFSEVIEEIKKGNTYLLNLTFPTEIQTSWNLLEIFYFAKAPFKLYFKDKFVCFSPERFVRIEGNKIYTYPMKGTIDAHIPQAKELILNNQKEMAEHTMVVDLLRNDLGIIGKNVKVNKFRFIDKIKAGDKELLQVSSEIEATLENWQKNWLEMILKMLPAGSISGTPKKKTVEIIKRVEGYKRGFYTGIFGITDEKTFLDSAVIIRYIENKKCKMENKELKTFIYKSGGGITIDSNIKKEYEELVNKVYIPV
ncbi:para-aminobenzoate synthetase component I [Lebetimonas natsushimae]|uniref:Para-aminobenzoate synthetase component I n=1 Tax=Lebetimonas natsushimae TaxID=1936991 RepID=A0A292YCP0_9BACT|nr:aminodeoxychorismate synthase component I [Lebetimonas natsushimae]GAX87236.1 para-aminobenzoate synthetase component I [Lebetimonas natsushimae]